MNSKLTWLILLSFFCFYKVVGNQNPILKFKQNGSFKILQLTDVHWNNNDTAVNRKNINLFDYLVQQEKPDLIIFTGDVVVDPPIKEGWQAIGHEIAKFEIPWAVVLGNHDTETSHEVTRSEVYEYINQLPHYLKTYELENYNTSTYVLPIMSHNIDTTAYLLYCFDSHDYAMNQEVSHYAWINSEQIMWYRNISKLYKRNNKGVPVNSLAFFHIPLVEFNTVTSNNTYIGNYIETPSSPEINSGLFCSILEQNDINGVFVGHDHNNDFVAIYKDIALGYGRVSGYGAYGKLSRGGRVIKIYENSKSFDTWITDMSTNVKNIIYYPSGISSYEEATMDYLDAIELTSLKSLKQGLRYDYFEGRYKSVNQIKKEDFITSGSVSNFSLDIAQRPDSFAIVFNGYLNISEKGVYDFYVRSDDGSQLFIDNQLIVDNDGSHSAKVVSGRIALEEGFHEIKVLYFEDYMGEELSVSYSSRKTPKSPIPNNKLYYD